MALIIGYLEYTFRLDILTIVTCKSDKTNVDKTDHQNSYNCN
jgi:hypothetical protein